MLDRVFLSKLSPTGKIMYFVGQLVMLGILAAVMFGAMNMSFNDGQVPFVFSAIAIVIVWGLVCIGVWPRVDSPRIE